MYNENGEKPHTKDENTTVQEETKDDNTTVQEETKKVLVFDPSSYKLVCKLYVLLLQQKNTLMNISCVLYARLKSVLSFLSYAR